MKKNITIRVVLRVLLYFKIISFLHFLRFFFHVGQNFKIWPKLELIFKNPRQRTLHELTTLTIPGSLKKLHLGKASKIFHSDPERNISWTTYKFSSFFARVGSTTCPPLPPQSGWTTLKGSNQQCLAKLDFSIELMIG